MASSKIERDLILKLIASYKNKKSIPAGMLFLFYYTDS